MEKNESFGAYLKAQREKKGIRLEEIASITKIHLRSLEHLEAGQWKQLPPDPFLRGFIVAYAKYVGLEPKEAVQKFLSETQPHVVSSDTLTDKKISGAEASELPKSDPVTQNPIPSKNYSAPADLIDRSKTFPFKKVFIGVGAVAAVVLFVVISRVGQEAAEPVAKPSVAVVEEAKPAENIPAAEVPPLTNAPMKIEAAPTKVATTPEVPDEKAVAPTPAVPSEFAHELVIEGKERTWIKVVFDKEPPLEYFLPEGEKVTYRAKDKIKVVLGNSTGTKVVHNGTQANGVKLQGTIRQYLFPNDARFPQDAASRRAPSSKVVDGAAASAEGKTEAKAENSPAPAPKADD